jgi:hypothetical protein
MLPTDPWPAWILFAAALVQTAAAVIQLTQSGSGRRTATGVHAGVRVGLAALVLEFGAWLATRVLPGDADLVRMGVYAPAAVAGCVAFLMCLGALLTTPPAPAPPRERNAPLDPRKLEAWHAVRQTDRERYERELAESQRTPSLVFSLVLGAAGGLAVVATSLELAGILG